MHHLVNLQTAEIGSTVDGSILPHHYAWLLHVQAPRLFREGERAMSIQSDLQHSGSKVLARYWFTQFGPRTLDRYTRGKDSGSSSAV